MEGKTKKCQDINVADLDLIAQLRRLSDLHYVRVDVVEQQMTGPFNGAWLLQNWCLFRAPNKTGIRMLGLWQSNW